MPHDACSPLARTRSSGTTLTSPSAPCPSRPCASTRKRQGTSARCRRNSAISLGSPRRPLCQALRDSRSVYRRVPLGRAELPLPHGTCLQVVGLPCCDEVALRGMLALEAALVAHGQPLPAASGSATAVSSVGAAAGVSSTEPIATSDVQPVLAAPAAAAPRLCRQAYCPEPTLQRTLAALEAAKPTSKRRYGRQ